MSMNQRSGVFMVVSSVFGKDIAPNTKVELSKDQLQMVYDELFHLFKAGEIEYRGGVPDDTKLKKYIPGLVNNWMRKDLRLNGGSPYETKRPGSRAGSGDETAKAIRGLIAATPAGPQREMLEGELAKHLESIKPV